MSASREKKDRQGVAAQGMTQKQLKEAKEAQAAKRKTMVYWIVGIVITALVVALLVWGSGFFQKRATAAVIGDTKLSAGEMQYYYGIARLDQLNQEQYTAQVYAQIGMSYTPTYTNSLPDSEQVKDEESGQTWAEYFRERALTMAKQDVALAANAKANSHVLSADGKAAVAEGIENSKAQAKSYNYSYDGFLRANYGEYVDGKVYQTCLERNALASEYATNKQDSLAYTSMDLSAYQQENPTLLMSYDYRLAYISGAPETKTDDEGKTIDPTDEEKAAATAAAKEKADALVKGVQEAEGDKSDAFNTLVKDAVAADSSYADPEKNLHASILGNTLSENGATEFEWLSDSARKAGDISSIESGSGFYVVLFLKAELNNTPTSDIRHILINADAPKDDEATADVDESKGMPTQESMDAAKAKAQAILDEFNALSDDKRTSEAFGDLAKKNSADTASAANGGRMRYVSLPNNYVETFNDWIFDSARKSGDADLIENFVEGNTYAGYHIMYYVGQDGPTWHKLAEDALRSADMTEWLEGIQEPITAEWTDNGSTGK